MSHWSAPGRPTPNGWVAIGAAAVVCAVAAWVWLGDPTGTATARDVAVVSGAHPVPLGPPTVREPWYRVGLPVDGDLHPVGARTSGHAEVVRSADDRVHVLISGFDTDRRDADLRVQLTEGDVLEHDGSWTWVPDGDPVEIGTIAHGSATADIAVATPQILPREVHSLVVLDWNTSTILGAAELLPSTSAAAGR